MKNLLFIALAIVIATSSLQAETKNTRNSKGAGAILFNLNGLSVLQAGNYGGGLGFEYFFLNGMAARVGIGFNMYNESTPSPAANGAARKISSSEFQITPGAKWNFSSNTTITAYIGIEGLFKTTGSESEGANFSKDDPKTTKSTSAFGASAFLGAEWFAWENVSLGAEYKLTWQSESGSTSTKTGGAEESWDLPTTSSFGLGAAQYNFTIKFYFN